MRNGATAGAVMGHRAAAQAERVGGSIQGQIVLATRIRGGLLIARSPSTLSDAHPPPCPLPPKCAWGEGITHMSQRACLKPLSWLCRGRGLGEWARATKYGARVAPAPHPSPVSTPQPPPYQRHHPRDVAIHGAIARHEGDFAADGF